MSNVNKEFVLSLADQNNQPCITIYISTEAVREGNFKKIEIKLKNHLSEAAYKLKENWGFKADKVKEILKPAYDLVSDINFLHHHELGLALFISENKFEYVRFNSKVKDQISVSEHFYIIPLLKQLTTNSQYYILALSKNENKFFRANSEGITRLKKYEIEESLADYVEYEAQNSNTQQYSHQVSVSGTVVRGGGIVQEEEKEDLLKYLREIDDSIKKELTNKEVPLVLYCDEGLYHYYDKVNSYQNLFNKFLNGNPESLNDEEIHKNTWELIRNYITEQKEDIIDEFKNLKGSSKTTFDVKLIVPDAYYSKVYSLLIDGSIKLYGYFDEQKNKVKLVKNKKNSYDLFNYAAILTLRNGGNVYVFEDEIPEGIDIEAINRY